MTTYRLIKYDPANPLGQNIVVATTFRQTELQSQFQTLVKSLQPGESAEYMKEDEEYFYPSMAYVENENGILYSYTAKGHRRVSKYN